MKATALPRLSQDYLYHVMDDHLLRSTAGDCWHCHVYGIIPAADVRWVQAALLGSPNYAVLMRMSASASTRDLIRAVETWLSDPHSESENIIEVPRLDHRRKTWPRQTIH